MLQTNNILSDSIKVTTLTHRCMCVNSSPSVKIVTIQIYTNQRNITDILYFFMNIKQKTDWLPLYFRTFHIPCHFKLALNFNHFSSIQNRSATKLLTPRILLSSQANRSVNTFTHRLIA